ncbi:MAG: amidohydrolase [Bryobacteraceae bacterium]|nr:amidohydrolase [Bryobacteraceae bacterium]
MKQLAFYLLAPALWAQSGPDVLLVNGKIWTGNRAQPEVQAVAIQGDRILAAGSSADLRKLAAAATRVVDLGGSRVVPGFHDSHVHFYDGGTHLASVQLRDARSPEMFRDRIAEFAKKTPAGRWILGGDWDHENWTPPSLPTRQLIDAVTGEIPVFINRLDGHMALANTAALKRAGLTRGTRDPDGGAIVRDASGEPTGILKDSAMDLVSRVIPQPTEAEIDEALRAAIRHANEHGITSVTDMSASPDILRGYQRLLAKGDLSVRVHGHQPLADWKKLADAGVQAGFGNAYLRIGGLKGFADGSLGSTTALFFDNYLDEPRTAGLAAGDMIPEEKLLNNIRGADKAGLQVAVHAIGDRANRRVLDFFEQVAKDNGPRDRRFRIEHAQHVKFEDIRRFAKIGVVASMQAYHAIDDGRWAEKRIGAERARYTYAFRAFLDSGAVLAFGSDWYVAPISPMMAIFGAVTRRTLDNKNPGGWVPEQKITVAEAVKAYTWGSAYAAFADQEKGTIQPGNLADLAVLSEDIFAIAPSRIGDVKVLTTIVGGKVVFNRSR